MYKDNFYLTHVLFYVLGTASVVPQHFFTTATDYWMYKFRDPNVPFSDNQSQNRTGLQAQFISSFSIVSHVTNLSFLALTFVFLRRFSVVKRTIGGLCGVLIAFVITCIFVEVNTDLWQSGFFVVSLTLGAFLTACSGIFMATVLEIISRFPEKYIATMLSGHALCGMFAALVQIFSLSIGASSATTGLIYFLIGMFFILLTLIWFLMALKYSEFFKYYFNNKVEKTIQTKLSKEKVLSVFHNLKYFLAAMILAMGCTTIMHPGVLSLVVSMDKGSGAQWNDVFFVPFVSFFLYFFCDYIGRETAGFLKTPKNGFVIFIISFLRVALVPMLMLCNAHPRSHLPVIFDKDYAYIIFIICFAFSNGYLVNLCVIIVPIITKEEERNLTVILIVVFMLVSLGACSFLSAVMVKAL